MAGRWKSEGNSRELILSFHPVGPRRELKLVRLGN